MSPNSLYFIVSSVFIIVIGYDVFNWLRDRTISLEIRLQRFESKINNTVLIMGLTMVVVSILFHVNFLRYSNPLPFSEIDKITLKDFKGYQRPYQTLDGEKEFAFITTSIEWKTNDNAVEVETFFHPARSYVFNDQIVDRFLLAHELYHFRISEIIARKVRQELSQFKELPSHDAIKAIIAIQEEAENEMQYRYDEESYHGYVMKEQKRWQKETDSLLNLLDKFKTPSIVYE